MASTGPGSTALPPDFLARLPGVPNGYPQKIDLVREVILCLEMNAATYRAASFLDDRILTPGLRGAWFPIARLVDASLQVANAVPLHFIFHTGHVGSTLVSRLLDETGRVLSLREPLPLRTLADVLEDLHRPWSLTSEQRFDELVDLFMRLWSRSYDPNASVVVKATSSSGTLAPAILRRYAASRAIYLNVSAEIYLATLLGGANSAQDLRGHGPARMRRLHARLGIEQPPLHALSPGELAAMSWLVESLSQRDAVQGFAGQVLAVDFDRLLADLNGVLTRVLEHFELPTDPLLLVRLASSPVLRSYSKAPELPFTPEYRQQLLADSRQRHAHEIRKGLEWLQALGKSHADVAGILP
jgi:hypothetical protein